MVAPLDGIRVIDWSHVLAGPACSYYLGLLGAEVIKVERPGRGDAMRHRGGTDKARAAGGMSTAYLTQSAGKQSLALDLEREAGRAVFERLLKSADVLVENHRPDTLTHLGLEEEATRAINPRLIHCAMTGYGRGNAMADAPAYDVNIQAISGLMALTGTTETGPLRTGAPIIDYATGMAAAMAVMAALIQREKTGQGAFADVSMLDTAFALMSSTITDYALTGTEPKARGNAANSRSPSSGVFACAEGRISLGVNEEAQFRALAQALGRSEWLSDPRFADPVERNRNGAELGHAIAVALAGRSANDWEEELMAAGVPCAKLRTLAEALALPPAEQRGFARRGAAGYCGLPFQIQHASQPNGAIPPQALGTGTQAILRDLGYSETEIQRLADQGAVTCSSQ
ncbi:CaiB/BaiF CoA-transferase family protein [uncultured Roseobacter sp.]|uniref:CaiB/BaiF CoA transferase family protein n=1 Tax=uncultured Roseobacter sp. TaxID=114847 RepID=UPI0026313056|nr:CaiB/BaiF CoA-transferase family protein [uncultured Roseobacter sp.]